MYDILRVTLLTNPPTDMDDINQCLNDVLEACMHDMRCAVNNTMQTPPPHFFFELVYN